MRKNASLRGCNTMLTMLDDNNRHISDRHWLCGAPVLRSVSPIPAGHLTEACGGHAELLTFT